MAIAQGTPIPVSELSKMPLGLLDCFPCTEAPSRWPKTVGGWWRLFFGTIICDVLRRCQRGGCWNRSWGNTLLVGRLCRQHWSEYYTDE